MVLHGVGGRTIAEAQRRMTYAEAMQWFKYIEKRGSLNVGLRVEAVIAGLRTQINRALGGKARPIEFMPYWDDPEKDVQAEDAADDDIERIAKLFGAVMRKK